MILGLLLFVMLLLVLYGLYKKRQHSRPDPIVAWQYARPWVGSQFAGGVIYDMLNRGYDCQVGPHYEALGYYALFTKDGETSECQECMEPLIDWNDCGHGFTPLEAISMAKHLIDKDVDVLIPDPSVFNK